MLAARLAAALAALAALPAAAEVVPPAGSADSRVRVVPYDPDQVVRIEGFVGFSIHLQFAPGETLLPRGVGSGDSKSFEVGVVDNNTFLKPKVEKNWTNLTIVTNRRVYHLDYNVQPAPKRSTDPRLVYSIRFVYPADEARAARAALERQRSERVLASAEASRPANTAYDYCGSPALRPVSAHDDGVVTRLRFAAHGEFPTMYVKNDDDSESLLNFHVERDGEVVIHRVARRFVLRRGALVGCVVNQAFPGGASDRLPTHTSVSGVERVTLGANP